MAIKSFLLSAFPNKWKWKNSKTRDKKNWKHEEAYGLSLFYIRRDSSREAKARERVKRYWEKHTNLYTLRIWKPSIKRTVLLLYFFNNTHTYDVVLSASFKKKKKQNTEQILYRFGSAIARFWISQSVDFTAPALEWRAKSERRPRLIQSALQSGRCRRRRSIGSVPVKFCTPLVNGKD